MVVNYHVTPNRHIRIAIPIDYRDDLLQAKAILAELCCR
jgi:small-conductance mechanosensitive channel